MATENRVEYTVLLDASGMNAGAQQGAQALDGMRHHAQTTGAQASQAIDRITQSAGRMGGATQKLENSLAGAAGAAAGLNAPLQQGVQAIDALGQQAIKTGAAITSGAQQGAQAIDNMAAQALAAANAATQAARSAGQMVAPAQAGAQALDKMGMSAKQTAMAMRMVPMQVTDVVTSLVSGMPVWMVAVQQGGQLKDSFGGIIPAAKGVATYVAGLIGPLTIAGTAMTALAAAAYLGANEQSGLGSALILTGNRAGASADQLYAMSARMGELSGITRGQAVSALAEFVHAGVEGGDALDDFATAALQFEQVTGQAVSKTAEQFKALQDEPVKASIKLHEQIGHLTLATYEQIKALDEQGRKDEAAAAAQRAYANSLADRAAQVSANLGVMQRAWNAVGRAAAWAWDQMKAIGRVAPLQEQLAAAEKNLQALESTQNSHRGADWINRATEATRARIAELKNQIAAETASAEATAKANAQVAARASWDEKGQKYLSDAARLERDIAAARREGVEAGVSTAEIEKRVAEIRAEATKKPGSGRSAAAAAARAEREAVDAEIEHIKGAYKQAAAVIATERAGIDSLLQQGVLSEEAAIIQREALAKRDIAAQEAMLQAQLKALESRQHSARQRAQVEQELAALAQKRIDVQAKAERELAESQAKGVRAMGQSTAAIIKQAEQLEKQNATFGKSTEAITELTIAELELQRASLEATDNVIPGYIDALDRQIAALNRLREAQAIKTGLEASKKAEEAASRAAEQAAKDAQRSIEQTAQSLSDALMQGGKSAGEYIEGVFRNLVLKPVIQWVMTPVAGLINGVVNAITDGAAGSQGALGLLNNGSSLYSLGTNIAAALGLGSSAGATSGSLMLGNAVGALGGDGLGAMIAANGAWSGVGTGAATLGAGQGVLAPGAIGSAGASNSAWLASAWPVAAVLGVGLWGMSAMPSRPDYSGYASASSDPARDRAAMTRDGTTFDLGAGLLPDREALIAAMNAAGITQLTSVSTGPHDRLFGGSNRGEIYDAIGRGGVDGPDVGLLSTSDLYGLIRGNTDFYDGPGYVDPASMWIDGVSSGMRAWTYSAEMTRFGRQVAEGVLGSLESVSSAFGLDSDWRVIAGLRDEAKKDGLYGSLRVSNGDQTILDYEGKVGKGGGPEYLRQVTAQTMEVLKGLDLPEWARGLISQTQEAVNALDGKELGDKLGEAAIAALGGLEAALAQTAQTLGMLSRTVIEFQGQSQDAIYQVTQSMGGFDAFNASFGSFVNNFYTESERAALLQAQVQERFNAINVAMPATREEFVALVRSADLTTEAGRNLFVSLMSVQEAFAQLTTAGNGTAVAVQAAFQGTSQLASVITQGLLGHLSAADLGGQMADVVMGGIYNAVASGFADEITQIIVGGVVNPVVRAAVTGASVSEAVSAAAIDQMVADATRVAQAMGEILNNPEFQAALRDIEGAVTSVGSSMARSAPVYVSYDRQMQERQRALEEQQRAQEEHQQRLAAIASEREGLMRQLYQLEGNTAALREMELAALDPSNRALQKHIWALQDQKAAADAAAASLKSAQDFLSGVTRNIRDFVSKLSTQTSDPEANYTNAWAQYNSQLVLARGGDREALGAITSHASALIEQIRKNASSGAEADLMIGRIRGQLLGLPERLSAEQLVVNAIQDMTAALSSVLVTQFEGLDTNLDGLLTADELRASGLASNASIANLIARVDVNGDGMISKTELVRAGVSSVNTSVGTNTSNASNWLSNVRSSVQDVGYGVGNVNTSVGNVRNRVGDVDESVKSSGNQLVHGGMSLADWAQLTYMRTADLNTKLFQAMTGQDSFVVRTRNGTGQAIYFAHGGAFTNSIVSTPTAFQVGVMGEAGPEAIMPLARTASGDLGVQMLMPRMADSSSEMLAVMRALLAEFAGLRRDKQAQALAIVSQVRRSANAAEKNQRIVTDWDRNGMPPARQGVPA